MQTRSNAEASKPLEVTNLDHTNLEGTKLEENKLEENKLERTKRTYTAVLGKGMLRNNQLLPVLMNQPVKRWYPWHRLTRNKSLSSNSQRQSPDRTLSIPSDVAGWGQKKSFKRAKKLAHKLNRPVLSLEDGFLRSITSGIKSNYGCSIVVDDIGIYFDSKHPSKLERDIVARLLEWDESDAGRSQSAIEKIIDYRLSKYNSVWDCPNLSHIVKQQNPQPQQLEDHVLVIDQVKGDASIKGAGATSSQFWFMLKTACATNPDANIWIKAHPASKSGHLNDRKILHKLSLRDQGRIHLLQSSVNPISLIKQVSQVYTVSSHMGFEALLLGKSVHCFGVSWYSGWGLTNDRYAPQSLLKKVIKRRETLLGKKRQDQKSQALKGSVLALFYAAYIDYSRYADPATGKGCELEQVIEWLGTNRYWYLKLPSKLTIYEFSRWKIKFVTHFLNPINNHQDVSIKIKRKPRLPLFQKYNRIKFDPTHDILVWGLANAQKLNSKIQQLSKATEVSATVWCMEDGFIRSNGLGATLLEPLSVVIDNLGIYYDATRESDLERLIAQCDDLNQQQYERVQNLHQKLLNERVSKYHVGQSAKISVPDHIRNNQIRVILVVGQVEDDLSVQYCGSLITTNSALIERVRQDNPDSYLIYKPHPDVEAGLRTGQVAKSTLKLVDYVAHDVAMPDCLDAIDEVHTISSLTGFEALLRDKTVYCYGLPFYAGWGLTVDVDSSLAPKSTYLKRRHVKRLAFLQAQSSFKQGVDQTAEHLKLTLEQLIHCSLIIYPMYRLPNGYGLAQVEQVIDFLYGKNKPMSSCPEHTSSDKKSFEADHQVQQQAENISNKASTLIKDKRKFTVPTSVKRSTYYDQVIRFSKVKFMRMRHKILESSFKKDRNK